MPDDVVSSIDQQLPAEPITIFSDLHRLVILARIGTSRHQSEKRAGTAAADDPSRVFDRQHVSERRQRAHAGDLRQPPRGRMSLEHRVDAAIELPHLLGERADLIEHHCQCRRHLRNRRARTRRKRLGRALRQSHTEALARAAHVVDQ